VGTPFNVPGVDPLKYQEPARPDAEEGTGEWLTLKLRYKEPEGSRSALIEVPFADVRDRAFHEASADFRFAAAVAGLGMTLRHSSHKGDTDLGKVMDWAQDSLGDDESGLRAGFLELIGKARSLSPR
jgi:Ca-activated chloride channel family protein